jgi:hypothetical protein
LLDRGADIQAKDEVILRVAEQILVFVLNRWLTFNSNFFIFHPW